MHDFLAASAQIDWSSTQDIAERTQKMLVQLSSERNFFEHMIESVADDPSLSSLCEHYDLLDKLVLYNDKSGSRLRLHLFLPGYFDRPHNHRWSYSSLILRGGYQHFLYGEDKEFDEMIDVSKLQPIMVRRESVGSYYALSHKMIHSVTADPHTISLVFRGPAVKERFLVTDRTTNRAWWQYGSAAESVEERDRKRMSPRQLTNTIATIQDLIFSQK